MFSGAGPGAGRPATCAGPKSGGSPALAGLENQPRERATAVNPMKKPTTRESTALQFHGSSRFLAAGEATAALGGRLKDLRLTARLPRWPAAP